MYNLTSYIIFYLAPDMVYLSCFCCDRICAGCNTDIGHGRFLSCMNALWHPQCFRCRGCNQPISDYEVKKLKDVSFHLIKCFCFLKKLFQDIHHYMQQNKPNLCRYNLTNSFKILNLAKFFQLDKIVVNLWISSSLFAQKEVHCSNYYQ